MIMQILLSLFNYNNLNTNPKIFLDYIRTYRKNIDNDVFCAKTKLIKISEDSPVFLIGFPRSGTTLLDTILRSHPEIDVLEEKPLINSVEQIIKSKFNYSLNELHKLSENDLNFLRNHYLEILKKNSVKKGDLVIGLSSSGVHSNGFSLVRKIIEVDSIDIFKNPKFEKNLTLAEILMKPTILYTNAFLAANKNYKVKSISHITGGGLIENPPRAFNENLTLKFDMKNFKLPPLFNWLKHKANISLFELTKTFNCGIGFLIFVDKNDAQEIINDINKIQQKYPNPCP